MRTLPIGDEFLAISLPDSYQYGYRDNGALMGYLPGIDALNLHVSTITAKPKDSSHIRFAFDRVAQEAKDKGLDCRIAGSDRAVYSYTEQSQ